MQSKSKFVVGSSLAAMLFLSGCDTGNIVRSASDPQDKAGANAASGAATQGPPRPAQPSQ